MVKLQHSILRSREVQTSNLQLYRFDLPKAGCYSALDISFRIQNGATSAINLDILDIIKHISLVVNGNDYRYHIKGQDLFRYHWQKYGRPMPYTFTEKGSATQEVWFRLAFGRFLGDPQFGLDLSRFANVQVQIDYDAVAAWGAAAAGTFTTGTCAITLVAHEFPRASRPSFRGMIGVREFWTGTTAASGTIEENLPTANMILAVGVSCLEDGVAEATDITDIKIGKDNYNVVWIDGKWYLYQDLINNELDVREEHYDLYVASTQVKDTHLANIKSAVVTPRVHTVPT